VWHRIDFACALLVALAVVLTVLLALALHPCHNQPHSAAPPSSPLPHLAHQTCSFSSVWHRIGFACALLVALVLVPVLTVVLALALQPCHNHPQPDLKPRSRNYNQMGV
jgi:hypothetical protein